jgi:hypothetical protein
MSRKQEIYQELLFWAIPHIRNTQTQSMLAKAFDKSCYEEVELVHNLQVSILEPEFLDHDIHFLNCQARNYTERAAQSNSPCYGAQCTLIEELINLVPEPMRNKLEWSGPES